MEALLFMIALDLPQQDEYAPNGAKTKAAVEKGLQYLAANQGANGAWRTDRDHLALTAVAALAMMSNGSYPDRGMYADHVAKALDWVLQCQGDSGFISANGSRMYEHGLATLFLAEVMGMTPKRQGQVEQALRRSVALYAQSQSSIGGWRYQPAPADADLSLTIVALQALRAARNRGIEVPREVIARGMEYVRRCENSYGGFRYTPGGRETYAMAAAGLVCYYSVGTTKEEEQLFQKHFEALQRRYQTPRGIRLGRHFFYGNYYAAQACYQKGGEIWEWYWNRAGRDIIDGQQADGCWMDDVHPNFATAMACIILQIPREYIPIMQK